MEADSAIGFSQFNPARFPDESISKETPSMKKTVIPILALAIAALLVGIFVAVSATTNTDLTEQEKLAMETYPGFSFVFNGTTNRIVKAHNVRAFTSQHPMIPYLIPIVEDFKRCNWSKDDPFRIEETETQVIIRLPSYGELKGIPIIWDSGWRLRVFFDKKTKTIISALQG